MNSYAIIGSNNCVLETFVSPLDAGHQDLVSEGDRRAARHDGARWVYVEEPCEVGDYLDVDEDGCATVRECPGHPAGPYDPWMGAVYCDGSCRS